MVIQLALFLCALLSVATTAAIIYVLLSETVFSPGTFLNRDSGQGTAAIEESVDELHGRTDKAFFQLVSPWEFLTGTEWTPNFVEKHFGVLPLICGTLLIAGIAALFGLPIGIFSAVYLSEYASPRARNLIKPTLEILAGVPSVVYGYFALQVLTPWVIKPIFENLLGFSVEGYNALSAGLIVGVMIIPMVCSLSEDALRAVPRTLREAGYALGSTKFDVSAKIVLPAAFSGIVASFLLAVSRALGETMAVAIAAGSSPTLTLNPLNSVQTMTSYIVVISSGEASAGTIEYKSLYAVGLCLFTITLIMNIVSQQVMRRYREVYH